MDIIASLIAFDSQICRTLDKFQFFLSLCSTVLMYGDSAVPQPPMGTVTWQTFPGG